MGKKKKLGISSLIERVEQLVGDALKQIDTLQSQVNDLREQVMERVGLGDKPTDAPQTGTSSGGQPATQSKPAAQAAPKTTQSPGKSGTNTGKTAGKKTDSGKDDLTRIKGIGPATAEKMQAKGITSINQLANPSEEDQKKLEAFRKLKNFASWQEEAKKLV
ncbi:helix-hairpin-helix domain-containing protein [Halomonadaceae bacterium KBTZ08]